jgi:hypothetical protein
MIAGYMIDHEKVRKVMTLLSQSAEPLLCPFCNGPYEADWSKLESIIDHLVLCPNVPLNTKALFSKYRHMIAGSPEFQDKILEVMVLQSIEMANTFYHALMLGGAITKIRRDM